MLREISLELGLVVEYLNSSGCLFDNCSTILHYKQSLVGIVSPKMNCLDSLELNFLSCSYAMPSGSLERQLLLG